MVEKNPYTFFVPSNAEKAAIRKGDALKLLFEGRHESCQHAERMWVVFDRSDDDAWVAYLDNEPVNIPGLNVGDEVRFQPWHILSVWKMRVDDGSAEDRFFARCHADPRIIQGAPVDRMERRDPLKGHSDRFPDSGWHFFAAGSRPGSDPLLYIAVGGVLNHDASPLPHIGEPVGTRLRRDGQHFVRVAD